MKTLLVVDAQNDFMEDGPLEVPNANEIIPYINNISSLYDLVIWSKDWHPKNHCSFEYNNGIWPEHCVMGTEGAEIHKDLKRRAGEYIITKGTDPSFDSYSAFKDDGGEETGLASLLKIHGISEIDVCGLSLEYCVKFTVLDALKEGLKVNLLKAGCRGIDQSDINEALEEMKKAGATIQ